VPPSSPPEALPDLDPQAFIGTRAYSPATIGKEYLRAMGIGASFIAMFWLGSLVTYRPRAVAQIMDGIYAPMLSEFVAMNPTQFLYRMTNHMTGSECVKPYAHV
jgi:hypothetical protein